jgi:D-alanyl-D-alanine carboxypeptidase
VFRRALAYAPTFVVVFGVFLTGASAREDRHAALILDANTGAVLHDVDGDESRHPASLTKMMTLYLTFETLDSGRLKMSDKLTISEAAASVAPSKLDLDPGDQIAVSDAIRAVITKSANDIAVALAEKIGGSEANFVRLMNARALEIGMSRTHYENASGLPNSDQITTARDMATLALHLQDDFPEYYPLFATRVFSYGGKSFRNHNTMLNSFAGIDGIKTGYTRASGFNLVTSWHRGDRHLIGVVFGGDTAGERNAEMRVLLMRMASRASSVKTRKSMLLARLKSEPKMAQRPAKRKPALVEIAEASPVAARKPSAPEPLNPSADTTETPIHVFKVHAVPMVPRARRAPASPDETTDMEDSGRTPDRAPNPSPAAPSRTDMDRVAEAPAQSASGAEVAPIRPFAPANLAASGTSPADSSLSEQATPPAGNRIAMLGASDAPPAAAMAPETETPQASPPPRAKTANRAKAKAAKAAVPRPTPVIRGLPPSTLGAQASSLNGASGQENFEPRRSAAQGPVGRYAVQIGAYVSIDDAQRALSNVQGRAGRLLAGVSSVTNPATKDGHQVYRARFTGFDATRATSTCNALRRQSVDCFVMAGD